VKEFALPGSPRWRRDLFLRDVYIPPQRAFCGEASQEGSAFVAIPGVDLREILCVQEERQVGNDNCVSFNRLKLQIPESPLRAHFVKRRSRSGIIRTEATPSSTVNDALAATTRKGRSRKQNNKQKGPPESARRPACGNVDKASALTTVHRRTKTEEADISCATKTGQVN